jgi:hypothetical protein
MLAPRARLPDLKPLIDQDLYFVVHAARQTGKTTAMRAFAEELRQMGTVGVWATLEESQGVEEEERAEPRWLRTLVAGASELPPELKPPDVRPYLADEAGGRLRRFLSDWCAKVAPRPVVLLLDEADTVSGPALISLLRQLRAGFMDRGPGRFPSCVALIGMRDLRDYLATAKGGGSVNPGSPFNIKKASLTLRPFRPDEVAALLHQHTEETGQPFLPEAAAAIFHWGQGQPFLTNALADICVTELVTDRSLPIHARHVEQAKEQLILSRTTHLDSLTHRLREERIARVIVPILLGDQRLDYGHDDFDYAMDLGLVCKGPDGAEVANPIYREVLIRDLTYNEQENLPRPWWPWATRSGGLDIAALSDAFVEWWRENAAMVERHAPHGYLEAVPHIALMAFLQKVVNGGGRIHREYAAGRGRIDLLVEFKDERHAIELKRVFDGGLSAERVRRDGIRQLCEYLHSLDLNEGWLWIFDQRKGRSWEQRVVEEELEVEGCKLHIRGA